jgi:hypothetical protein
MKKGYNNITLGLILATFHINLGTLQIVPTFIGWIIVAMGVDSLLKPEGQALMNKSKKLSEALIITSLLGLIMTALDRSIGNPYLLTIIVSLIELFFIYYFLRGVTERYMAKGKITDANENEKILNIYIIFHIIGILIICVYWLKYSSLTGSFLAFYMMGLRIYIIYQVYKLGKLCSVEEI